jgi:ABC-type phosphate/phosphonate transport system permease subunit
MNFEYYPSVKEAILICEYERRCIVPEETPARIRVADTKRDMPAYLFLSGLACLTILSLLVLNLDWGRISERLPRLGKVFVDLAHFSTERFSLTMLTLTETVSVSLLALIYGLVLGMILGALAAKNITPWKPLSTILKSAFAFVRAVPTPVWVLLVLASMGFGMASGIMGLGFHVTGFFGKVFAQLFEERFPTRRQRRSGRTGSRYIRGGWSFPSLLPGVNLSLINDNFAKFCKILLDKKFLLLYTIYVH